MEKEKEDEMKKSLLITILALLLIAIIFFAIKLSKNYSYSGNAPQITEKELKCGAYWGNSDQKKTGTPEDWIWVNSGRNSYWKTPNATISPAMC